MRSGQHRIVDKRAGAIAQMGERLLCTQEVAGSTPVGSTSTCGAGCPDGGRNRAPREFFNNPESRNDAERDIDVVVFRSRVCCIRNHQAAPTSRRWRSLGVIWSSDQAHAVDALAATGDEGRGSLR